jgi:hypothetical protein
MEVTRRLIVDLLLDPENARKHSQKNLDAIKASLTQFGQRKPIVINSKGVILAGNGTVEAARTLGWDHIDVAVVPSDWDEATARAYALADNRTAVIAAWDDNVLAKQLLELIDGDFDIDSVPKGAYLLQAAGATLYFNEEFKIARWNPKITGNTPTESDSDPTTLLFQYQTLTQNSLCQGFEINRFLSADSGIS